MNQYQNDKWGINIERYRRRKAGYKDFWDRRKYSRIKITLPVAIIPYNFKIEKIISQLKKKCENIGDLIEKQTTSDMAILKKEFYLLRLLVDKLYKQSTDFIIKHSTNVDQRKISEQYISLSAGGIGFFSKKEYYQGQTVLIVLKLPKIFAEKSLHLLGVVVRCDHLDSINISETDKNYITTNDHQYYVGVKFANVSKEIKNLLITFVDVQQKTSI